MDLPELRGDLVHLRRVAEADRRRIVEIRTTGEVARRWRVDNLDAEFTDDLADPDLHQVAVETAAGHLVGMVQFGEEPERTIDMRRSISSSTRPPIGMAPRAAALGS